MRALITIALCCTSFLGFADTPSDTFDLANQAFQEGAIEDAIQLYQSIADKGYGSYELFHNLGSAYASREDWYRARLYLERSLILNPGSKATQVNLELVKEEISDPYDFPKYPLFSTIEAIHSIFGINFLSLLLLLLICTTAFIAWAMLAGHLRLRRSVYYLAVSLVVLLCVVGLVFMEKVYLDFHGDMAIVSNGHQTIYQQPTEESTVLSEILAGSKVRITESVGTWIKVDLADGTQGWMPNDHLTMLPSDFALLPH